MFNVTKYTKISDNTNKIDKNIYLKKTKFEIIITPPKKIEKYNIENKK
jgi:hypothetical protein